MKKILLIIIMLAASLPAWADEKALSIGEVVITATRAEEDIDKISSNVTVITQEEIKKSTATTVQDLLRSEDGLIVTDLFGTGTKSTVDMRGFTRGLNTVILIDGRRLNEIDLSGVDWNTIPMENIERIEVVRGSQGVLYGDNAMAGAINIITKRGFNSKPELMLDARAESYSGHSKYGTFTGGNEQIGYFFFIKQRKTYGYRENSDFSALDMSTRLNFKVTDYLNFTIAAGYHDDQQGLPGGLTEDELKQDRRQAAPLHPKDRTAYDQRYIDAKANFALSTWGDLELGYSFNNRRFDSRLIYFGLNYDTQRSTDTIGLNAKLTVDTKLASFRNLLVTGIDFYDSTADNTSSSIWATNIADISKKETGLYAQDELFITDKLSLSLGYRYTDTKFSNTVSGSLPASGEQVFRQGAIKAGATFNYMKGSKVFVNYSKGYRLPTTDELFSYDGTINSLKPEKSDTYEAGVVHSFGKRLQVRATAYVMDVKDELYYNPTGGPFGFGANENLDKTRHYGVETGFSATVADNLSVFGSVTYSEAKFKAGPYDGNHIQLVPTYSGAIGADYRFLKSFLAAANATWVSRKHLDNDVENAYDKMDSHISVDTKLSYTYKMLTAYVGVNNIFNEKYSEYGIVGFGGNKNFYPAPERNFYGGLKIAL